MKCTAADPNDLAASSYGNYHRHTPPYLILADRLVLINYRSFCSFSYSYPCANIHDALLFRYTFTWTIHSISVHVWAIINQSGNKLNSLTHQSYMEILKKISCNMFDPQRSSTSGICTRRRRPPSGGKKKKNTYSVNRHLCIEHSWSEFSRFTAYEERLIIPWIE